MKKETMMNPSRQRVENAFAHRQTDRTPLFELYQPYHPIHWQVCGRGLMTDMAYTWDAMAEGVSFEELVETEAQAKVKMAEFFALDIMHIASVNGRRDFQRPVKTGKATWHLAGTDYALDESRGLIFPSDLKTSVHQMIDESTLLAELEQWDGESGESINEDSFTVFRRVKELVAERKLDIMYLGELGAGTGVAFWPPFQLMWLITEPQLAHRYIKKETVSGFRLTEAMIDEGCDIIAMGGDVSSDKGPFVSPDTYREFILPVVQEHIRLIQNKGAYAVYTSDGNHWPIKDEIFFQSGADGYKEVDYAAGMTMERLIVEGVKDRVCILGNVDARHTMCDKTPADVRQFVLHCLKLGRKTPGGHILHTSHSIHEDVKVENYLALVNTYREYFALEPLE